MRTADLQDALLDYWTARAEGVPAADLELRANGTLCVRNLRGTPGKIVAVQVLDYSTNWALAGPLVEKHRLSLLADTEDWTAGKAFLHEFCAGDGETNAAPLTAICRAVVSAAFGDEVEDLPC